MIKRVLAVILVLISFAAQAQKQHTLSGYITDAESGESLINAYVWAPDLRLGSGSNNYGFYTLTLPEGTHVLKISFIGYADQIVEIDLNKDMEFNFELSTDATMLTEVEVNAEALNPIEERVQMSKMEVPIKQLKSLPAIMGEVDIMKTLQLLPGVQSGGEGTSGLYVRGGSPDQNLILLDGVPLYNVNHLFGFFSVFNADAISNVSLTKGGFPARYGGRLSSVLEINMKEGNMKEFHGDWTSSIIASKLTLEGPLIKDKASFMISGRRTYIDLLAAPFIASMNNTLEGSTVSPTYYFYDMNAKVNYKVGKNDRIYLSHFQGKDDFGISSEDQYDAYLTRMDVGLDWQNSISAARWNHQWSPKLFSNATLTRSEYKFNTRAIAEDIFYPNYPDLTDPEEFKFAGLYYSGIEDYGARLDFDYVPNPLHYIRYGAGWTYHTFSPGASNFEVSGTGFNMDTVAGGEKVHSNEFFSYIEDEWKINENFKINGGLHFAGLNVEDKDYFSIQPRFGMNYNLPGDIALKASYAEMMQFVNLLTNEGLGLPTDLWVPSTATLRPQESTQYALGLAKTFKNIEFSIEGYYKTMENLVSYKEGASFLFSLDEDWEDKITQGNGTSYGLEFFAQKKAGKTTGWIGYTLAYSYRQFDEINGGKPYFFTYDRRHDISVVLNHEISETFKFSAIWVYGTGRAVTLPEYSYLAGLPDFLSFYQRTQLVESTEDKNSFRMSPYHRMDVSLSYIPKKKQGKDVEQWWTISAYNAYNNLNPFFMNTSTGSNGEIIIKEYGLFPIIPSIAYRRKF